MMRKYARGVWYRDQLMMVTLHRLPRHQAAASGDIDYRHYSGYIEGIAASRFVQ